MKFHLLSADEIVSLHEHVLNAGELTGVTQSSLEGALSRVEFRITYGLITDVYDLAAMCVVSIARAHAFKDANKRTAYLAMEYVLELHNRVIVFDTQTIGDVIVAVAKGTMDEVELAAWLRARAN